MTPLGEALPSPELPRKVLSPLAHPFRFIHGRASGGVGVVRSRRGLRTDLSLAMESGCAGCWVFRHHFALPSVGVDQSPFCQTSALQAETLCIQ